MSEPINIDTTLDVAGGDDEVRETTDVQSEDAAFQFEIGGATTDTDVHFEARLSDSLPWEDYLKNTDGGWTALSNGATIPPLIVDLGAVDQIRVRVVNQDGANQAEVTATVITQ